MSEQLNLPLLQDLIEDRLEYGVDLLIEFEPHSIWYDASLSIAARALRAGMKVDYHTFMRQPIEIRKAFDRMQLSVEHLQEEDFLRIIDSYTTQTGLGSAEKLKHENPAHTAVSQSLKLSDLSIGMTQGMKDPKFIERNRRRLHIDDNSSVFLQYNEERALIDFYRTRIIPLSRTWERVGIHSFMVGVHSEAFYRQLESICDGVIDFRSPEENGRLQHTVRVRSLRGKRFDTRWRVLRLAENGDVEFAG